MHKSDLMEYIEWRACEYLKTPIPPRIQAHASLLIPT